MSSTTAFSEGFQLKVSLCSRCYILGESGLRGVGPWCSRMRVERRRQHTQGERQNGSEKIIEGGMTEIGDGIWLDSFKLVFINCIWTIQSNAVSNFGHTTSSVQSFASWEADLPLGGFGLRDPHEEGLHYSVAGYYFGEHCIIALRKTSWNPSHWNLLTGNHWSQLW